MTLVDAIERAHAENEKKLASQVPTPKQELDSEAIMHLRRFAEWCKSRGVKCLPCGPTTAAAFIRHESAAGVPADRILSALEAIEAAHSGLSNPIASAAPRAELARILKLEGEPRSWSKPERLVFAGLPPEVQGIITRRAKRDSDLIRRLQNENHQLKMSLNTKGNTENATDQERHP
jgi:hypothetical protein